MVAASAQDKPSTHNNHSRLGGGSGQGGGGYGGVGGYGDDASGHMDPLGGFAETDGDVSTGMNPINAPSNTP